MTNLRSNYLLPWSSSTKFPRG